LPDCGVESVRRCERGAGLGARRRRVVSGRRIRSTCTKRGGQHRRDQKSGGDSKNIRLRSPGVHRVMLRTATTYGDRLMILIGIAALPMSRRDKESSSTPNPYRCPPWSASTCRPPPALGEIRSERISLDAIEDAFHKMHAGEILRSMSQSRRRLCRTIQFRRRISLAVTTPFVQGRERQALAIANSFAVRTVLLSAVLWTDLSTKRRASTVMVWEADALLGVESRLFW